MLTPNSVVGTVDCKLESTPFLMLVIHTGSSWWAQTCEITLDSMMNSVGNRDKSAASTSVWSFPSILTLSNWKTFFFLKIYNLLSFRGIFLLFWFFVYNSQLRQKFILRTWRENRQDDKTWIFARDRMPKEELSWGELFIWVILVTS